MHIVIGALSAMAGLIWAFVALQRSGFNPDSINPFLWYRRAQWRRKYGVRPIYNLDDPMDVAAVLILGVAKCEGEISREQKQAIQGLFETEFGLDNNAAADLLLTTCVAEGFGMVFLEAWLAGRNLVGRDLPEITADFVEAGIQLDSLFARLPVPIDWVGKDNLLESLVQSLTHLRLNYGFTSTTEEATVSKDVSRLL